MKRCGLRYWPEKGGDPVVKWLPDCAVPLAKRAVDDLTRLCQKAREAAAVLERHPDRVSEIVMPAFWTMSRAEIDLEHRRRVKGLHPDRAPTIVAGVVILLEALRAFDLDEVEVSEHDILWGAALSVGV